MKKVSTWLWGIVLIALGVIWGGNVLGIINVDLFFPGWWTLFIIVPCFISLFDDDDGKVGDLIGILIGVCLLLACQGILQFRMVWSLIVPVILIIIGFSMLFKDTFRNAAMKQVKKLQKHTDKEYWATFGDQKLDFQGEEFEGCKMQAVFGGIKLDLRDAKIKHDVVIEASSIFGGITILVPEGLTVKVSSTSVFGGVSNKHAKRAKKGEKAEVTVYVDATCLFGGVDVK